MSLSLYFPFFYITKHQEREERKGKMDCFGVKKKSCPSGKEVKGLAEKVRLLEGEIKALMCEREKESRGYEREKMIFAFKEAEWKQERKTMKEEVRRLRKMVEVKEEESKGSRKEDGHKHQNWTFSSSGNDNTDSTAIACSLLVEQMREERVWRDEAVDKWKKLYLAIKAELDDLIQITHHGDGLCRKAEEEDMIEELKMEVKAKEETIKELKERLELAENEEYKRAREVDILRQSLRIVSSMKSSPSCGISSKPLKSGHVKQPRKPKPFN